MYTVVKIKCKTIKGFVSDMYCNYLLIFVLEEQEEMLEFCALFVHLTIYLETR